MKPSDWTKVPVTVTGDSTNAGQMLGEAIAKFIEQSLTAAAAIMVPHQVQA